MLDLSFRKVLVILLVAIPLLFLLRSGVDEPSSPSSSSPYHASSSSSHSSSSHSSSSHSSKITAPTFGVPSSEAKIESIPCGEVCRYDFPETQGKIFPVIKKNIDCGNIMKRSFLTRPATTWPPPEYPSDDQLAAFTQNGQMPITERYYFQQRYAGGKAHVNQWTEEVVEDRIRRQRNREQIGGYGLPDEDNIRETMKRFPVAGKRGAVLGSESPWVEAIVLDNGATHVTTIEYGEINSTHPKISTMVPSEAAELFLTGRLERFDFIYTYSSLEHSGLGRYGDSMNPYGDLEASAQAWCMLKPGGIFFLGLPVAHSSYIRFNADRNYGPERMKHMAAGFEQLDMVGQWYYQSIFVLKKESD